MDEQLHQFQEEVRLGKEEADAMALKKSRYGKRCVLHSIAISREVSCSSAARADLVASWKVNDLWRSAGFIFVRYIVRGFCFSWVSSPQEK